MMQTATMVEPSEVNLVILDMKRESCQGAREIISEMPKLGVADDSADYYSEALLGVLQSFSCSSASELNSSTCTEGVKEAYQNVISKAEPKNQCKAMTEKDFTCHISQVKYSHLHHLKTHFGEAQDNPHHCRLDPFIFPSRNKEITERAFECRVCHAKFKYREGYETHMTWHDEDEEDMWDWRGIPDDKEILFKVCKNSHLDQLNIHKDTHSTEEDGILKPKLDAKSYACPWCFKAFKYKKSMMRHSLVHHEGNMSTKWLENSADKPFACRYCEVRFSSTLQLKNHVRVEHSTGTGRGGNEKANSEGVENSKQNVHQLNPKSVKRQHKCEICMKSFGSKFYMKVHMKSHDGQSRIVGQVPSELRRDDTCDPSGNTLYSLESDGKEIGDEIAPNPIPASKTAGHLPCRYKWCGERFSDWGTLNAHITSHPKEKPFKCKLCFASYACEPTLEWHFQSSHKKSKKFRCSVCHQCLASWKLLRTHLLQHRDGNKTPDDKGGTKTKTVFCCLCSSKCPDKFSLHSHMQVEHPGTLASTDCNVKFSKKSQFVRLKQAQPQSAEFECDQCSAAFYLKRSLEFHMAQHRMENHLHLQKKYLCEKCDKHFSREETLQNHMRLHTRGRSTPMRSRKRMESNNSDDNLEAYAADKIRIRSHSSKSPYNLRAPMNNCPGGSVAGCTDNL